jgi:hypothetical protein
MNRITVSVYQGMSDRNYHIFAAAAMSRHIKHGVWSEVPDPVFAAI